MATPDYSMRQKNVSKIVQFNTVSFSKNAHETRVQRCRTTSQIVRIPFRFVSFRFVSFGTYRSVHSAENRAQNNGALILRRKAASLERLSPRSHVGMLWQPPGDEQKPREAFSKSGRGPRSLNLQRVRAPL